MTNFVSLRALISVTMLVLAVYSFADDSASDDVTEELAKSTTHKMQMALDYIKAHQSEYSSDVMKDQIEIARLGKDLLANTVKKKNEQIDELKKKIKKHKDDADTEALRADNELLNRYQKELFTWEAAYQNFQARHVALSSAHDYLSGKSCTLQVGGPMPQRSIIIAAEDVVKYGDLLFGIERKSGELKPYQSFDPTKGFDIGNDGKTSLKDLIEKRKQEIRGTYQAMVQVSFLKPTSHDKKTKDLITTDGPVTLGMTANVFPEAGKDSDTDRTYSAEITDPASLHVGLVGDAGSEIVSLQCK